MNNTTTGTFDIKSFGNNNFGWVNDPFAVKQVVDRLEKKDVYAAAPHLEGYGEDKRGEVYLSYKKLFGKHMPAQSQPRGTCLKAGSEVRLSNGYTKNIENIKIGDKVITHLGNEKKVITTSSKEFTGKWCKVYVKGYLQPLEATNDHKILKVVKTDDNKTEYVWTKIEDLKISDYILLSNKTSTIVKEDVTLDIKDYIGRAKFDENKILAYYGKSTHYINRFIKLDNNFLRLLGLYLAEGSATVQKNRNIPDRIVFTFNYNTEKHLAQEVKNLLKSIFDVDSKIIEDPGHNVVRVRANYCTLGLFLSELCGKGSLTKRLPNIVFCLSEDKKLSLLQGWAEGDGSEDKLSKVNTGTTSSFDMYKDLFQLCLSCGIVPDSYQSKQEAHQNSPANRLRLGLDSLKNFISKNNNFIQTDHGYALPIVKTDFASVNKLTVYDIGVEDDHSFTTESFAVHNCVSRCWSRVMDYLQCVKILNGDNWKFNFVSHSYVYGTSRMVGNWLSYEDGSVGAWAAEAAVKYGQCTRDEVGDPLKNDDSIAVEWGAKGVPQKYRDLGSDNLAKAFTAVKNAEQARDVLTANFPIGVCSNQGFTMTRDSKGRCTPSGTWNHAMMWSGFDPDLNRFLVEQSWDQNTPSGPLYLDQPDNSFWIDWDVADYMLRQDDSFVITDNVFWLPKNITYYI